MVEKNNDNTQCCRVANPDGTSPLGAVAADQALAPLCDEHGRLIVANTASFTFALDRTGNANGTSPAGPLAAGVLQPSLCDPHGRAIVSNLTSNADGTNPGGASAANTCQIPLVDSHGRLITVPYVGGTILSGAQTRVDSGAVVLWQLVSAAACKLYQAFGSQSSGGLLWALLFDLAAGPPGVATPYVSGLPVQNNGMWSLAFSEGLSFATGLVIAYSTVLTGYTAPAAGGWITALIR